MPDPCEPLSIDLEVDPPSGDTDIVFRLDKICNADDTVGWTLHIELQEKAADGTMKPVVNLDIDINDQDHPAAAATAKNGLDAPQRAQADVTGQVASQVSSNNATQDDVQQEAAGVIPARSPDSPV